MLNSSNSPPIPRQNRYALQPMSHAGETVTRNGISLPQKRAGESSTSAPEKQTVQKGTEPSIWRNICDKQEKLWLEGILEKYDQDVRRDLESIIEFFGRKWQERSAPQISNSNKPITKGPELVESEIFGNLIYQLGQLSFLVPRKKLHLELYEKGIRLRATDGKLDRQFLVTRVRRLLRLPLSPTNTETRQIAFVWMVEDLSGTIDTTVMSIMEDASLELKHQDGSEAVSIPASRLDTFLKSYFLKEPNFLDLSVFSGSARATNTRPRGIPCYQKTREGQLFLLQNGDICFGWKKPFVYIERELVARLEFLTITSRTFDIQLVANSTTKDSIEISYEFSMIEYSDFELISRFLEKHGISHNIQELSTLTHAGTSCKISEEASDGSEDENYSPSRETEDEDEGKDEEGEEK
jgi:hypothetical protein